MTKIKDKIICSLLLVLSIGIIFITHQNNISASFPGEFYEGENFTWTIDFINEGNIVWWNVSSFAFVANWYAENNSEVSFEVSDYSTIGDNDYLAGELTIGNLTLQTHNQDIGFNLALSVYPWYGGLVSLEQNWYELHSIPPLDNGTIAQITYDKQVMVLGKPIDAIQINYSDGFQESIFVYDPITGILLSTDTKSGSFHLKMHLTYTSMPLPTIPSELPLFSLICVIGGLGFLVIQLKKRKYMTG